MALKELETEKRYIWAWRGGQPAWGVGCVPPHRESGSCLDDRETSTLPTRACLRLPRYGQQRRTSRNSGHRVCEITSQQRKKDSLPFSSGLSWRRGDYLPKMPIWRLILLVLFPPGSPGCEKLNPTKPTSSPSKGPTSPSFCLLSSWNNPPQVFPGHGPHRVDRTSFF